ncbi:host specificity factor TipJ family phage tail protein [Comamonas testosteroni]|uniref:host specificity factor TipJ family phage tail protein n=1 Tax=Comamonas testosteroni TaxID=285 RepID=UPI0015FB1F91|nr:host specificity factor TipJ family phage tail protein [Comamonas testosteroni]
MELNRAESAAVAAVGGVSADVLDMAGRLVVSPNALTLDGQRNVPADLQPGESLDSFLDRHVPGIRSGAWTVMIGGAVVPQAMWARTFPKHGQLIACRAVLRRSALQLVALAALTYFSGGIASAIYGAAGGTYVAAAAGTWISAIQAGVFIAGSVLINKVLGPKIPSVQSLAQKQIYSLSDQRNTARPYEPIPVLWGEMRVTPDLASKAYAWYEGDDQYLSTILLGGINVHSAADLAIGDTPIGNYSDVSVYYNGFSGMASQSVPLYSNVDAVAGAEFVNGGDWITRTGSAGAGVLQLDIEGQLYDVGGKGNINANWVDLTIQARLVGAPAWTTLSSSTLSNASTDVLRRTLSFDVAPGQYEVRAKLGLPRWNDGGSGDACKFSWVSLKSVQADTTDYSQWGRIGIKIRASGQLSGSLDQVRATYRAKPMPIWTGTGWATATTRADGLSNPGAILLQTLRGVWVTDFQGKRILQFGFGLSDEQIDIEGLKAFMLHCEARGYTYDKWITSNVSLGAFCEEVALAGMGEFAWTDGSRPTAVFVTNGQPNSAVVNMANMLKGGFSVDYALSNAADGIEYQWLNRDTWEMTTLRVMAPGVTTMLSPARVTGEGITSEQHAAVMARYHLAQSLYQYKTVHYTADIEHLDYRRLSVLSVSHDLTQWGFGGRVMAAKRIGAQVQLTLDEPVPALASAYIGLRVPGARDYRVWPVQPLASESDVVTLVGEWPADLDFPGEGVGNPAHDTLWCYDFKATPGYRVRVTGIDPESDLKGARITAVPEGPEFWDYVLNGTYVPAPNQSSIPQLGRPVVKNLRVSEKVNLQGDTEWYELSCVWDVEGDCDHAQVWAGRDGSELRLVDGNAQGARSTFRIDGAGEWLIVVRPFNASGKAGQSAEKLYITTMTQVPPRNPGTFVVQQVTGGLRRFAWMYAGDKPAALAGVQIRYLPGDIPLSVDMWDAMQPLGEADDIYTAQFEASKPQAGVWTFGLRAIDTAGQLANGIVRFSINLDQSFDQIQQPDLTPPPLVTGLMATGMLTSVQVAWDVPLYTVGHGHARTEIWAGQGADLQQAAQVGEGYAGPISFSAKPAQSWNIWARNVSVDGVPGSWVGPVAAVTGEDVAGLLEVLAGKVGPEQLTPIVVDKIDQIDLIDFDRIDALNDFSLEQLESVAQVDLKRLDLIDIEGGPLGKSLVTAAAQQDALNQQVRGNMEDMATGLLEAALAADAALERITDAGVYVDPATGQVKIYGLETTKTQVTNLEVLLDALSGQLQLKASTAYVDGRIAEAVLSPADLLLYEGLDARLINVVQQLDSINGTLSSKAEALELQNAVARLTTAESNLDALGAQIALRVTRAEYEAAQDALQTRLGSAELTLSALDVPAITATVTAVSKLQRESDKTAQALLQDILNGEYNRVQAQDALAFARNQLSASIQEGLSAEAAARTQLAATVGQQAAALEQESLTRATADAAEASQRQALAATVQGHQQQTAAAIEAEETARANGDAAEAAQREALRAQMQGETDTLAALLEEEALTRATADSAEATARQQLAAQLQQAESALGAQVTDERNARIAADEAEAAARSALAARLDGKDSDLAAQVTAEQSARVAGDQAEALARQQLATRLDGVDASLSSQITNEQSARSAGDAAEAQARQQLAAVVEQAQSLLQAQITDEATARVEGDRAETASRESQISASRALSQKESERTAQALLQDILTGERNKEEARATLALAKSELATQIQEGLSAEALQRTQLAAMVDGQKAALAEESRVRADNDAAESATRAALAVQVQRGQEQTQAQIQEERQARADADAAEAGARQQLAAKVQTDQEAIQSQITAESQTRATDIAAEAAQRAQLAAIVGDNHAAVQQQFTAQAGINGYLAAKYSLAVQVASGGQVVVGGMQITGAAEGEEGAKIAVAFATDSFWIAAPDGSKSSVPFYVQPQDQVINGQLVPAGVFMDSARIGNVDVLLGRFGSLFADKVQATAISASQLTAGNGVIGGTLKSSNYVAGSSGWTLRPDGMAEFSGVIVRGTVYASSGQVGGVTIASNELHSSNWNGVYGPTGTGWAIRANGEAYFNGLNIRGQINGGAYTGYGWPAAGQSGFHLGPSGLLIGNANNGKYLQVTADGDIYTPGFNVVGGVMTVHQANIIDTLQIKSGALTSVTPRWRGNVAFFVSVSRKLDEFAVSPEYQNIIYLEWVNNIGGDGLYVMAYRGDGENSSAVGVLYPGAYARVELQFYANGSYMGTASVEVFQGIGNYVITPMFAVPLGATGVLVNMPPISRNSPEGQRSLNNIKITTISIKR